MKAVDIAIICILAAFFGAGYAAGRYTLKRRQRREQADQGRTAP